jgi:hypothetical protein
MCSRRLIVAMDILINARCFIKIAMANKLNKLNKSEYVIKTVKVTKLQNYWLEDNGINTSKLLRKLLQEHMIKKG